MLIPVSGSICPKRGRAPAEFDVKRSKSASSTSMDARAKGTALTMPFCVNSKGCVLTTWTFDFFAEVSRAVLPNLPSMLSGYKITARVLPFDAAYLSNLFEVFWNVLPKINTFPPATDVLLEKLNTFIP